MIYVTILFSVAVAVVFLWLRLSSP